VSELRGIARVKFHEGKVEEFKRLSAQAMEIARAKDTGTLQYDIYFNDDESEGIVFESWARRPPWHTSPPPSRSAPCRRHGAPGSKPPGAVLVPAVMRRPPPQRGVPKTQHGVSSG
jgi:hypothetical protein